MPLATPVGSRLRDIRPRGHATFRCLVIGATSQLEARQAADEVALIAARAPEPPQLYRIAVGGTGCRVFQVLPAKAVVRAARRARLPGIPLRWAVAFPVSFVVAVGLAVASALLQAVLGGRVQQVNQVMQPFSLAIAGLSGLVGVIGQFFSPLLRLQSSQETARQVSRNLGELNERAKDAFGAQLSLALADSIDEAVIVVDDFDDLDTLSKTVVKQHLIDFSGPRDELWVVFDTTDEVRNWANQQQAFRIGTQAGAFNPLSTSFFQLIALSSAQQAVLFGPDTAVAAITGRIATFGRDDAASAALELLQLLALRVSGGRKPFEFTQNDLKRRLGAAPGGASLVIRQILGPALPHAPEPSRTSIADQLTLLQRAGLLDADEGSSRVPVFSVGVPAAAAIAAVRGGRELPDPRLGHLFWLLDEQEHRLATRNDASVVRARIHHAVESVNPDDVPALTAQARTELARQFRLAQITVMADGLRLALLTELPALAQRLYDVVADRSQTDRDQALVLFRDLHATVGGERLQGLLLELIRQSAGAGSLARPDPLSLLFDRTNLLAGPMPAAAVEGSDSAFDRAVLDVQLQMAWLTLSMQPLAERVRENLPDLLPVIDAHLALPWLVRRALDNCGPGEPRVADLSALATAVWCLALADETRTSPVDTEADSPTGLIPPTRTGDTDPTRLTLDEWRHRLPVRDLADALSAALDLLTRLRPARGRRSRDDDVDLLFGSLVNEVLVTLACAAIRVRLRWTSLYHKDKLVMDDLIRKVAQTLRLPVRPDDGKVLTGVELTSAGRSVAGQLELLGAAWAALGYTQLSTALNTRRVQFVAALLQEPSLGGATARSRTVRGWVEMSDRLLLADRTRTDATGLLANLAAAEQGLPNQAVAAMIFGRSVSTALSGPSFSPEFRAWLAMLSLGLAHSYASFDHGAALDLLLTPTPGEPSRTWLGFLLERLSDDETEKVDHWITNVELRCHGRHAVALAEVERRIGAIADQARRDSALIELDLYRLTAGVRAGAVLDLDEVLGTWADRQDRADYPYLLYLLLGQPGGRSDRRLLELIDAVLKAAASYVPYSTAVVLLVHRVISAYGWPGNWPLEIELVAAVRAASLGMRVWQQDLDPDTAVDLARFLVDYAPDDRPGYRRLLRELTERQVLLFHHEQLAALMRDRQYAVLFHTYVRMFIALGLPTLDAPEETLGQWVPEPFGGPRGELVSLAFYRYLGTIVGAGPGAWPESLVAEANDLARDALPTLWGIILRMTGLAQPILDTLRAERRALQDALSYRPGGTIAPGHTGA